MAWLGLDLGTSRCKALLLRDDGTTVTASVPVTADPAPVPGEWPVEAWWTATVAVLRALGSETALADVAGVACIGNTPTLCLLDAAGQPVGPALLWSDARATAEAAALRAEHDAATWDAAYGLHLPVTAAYPSAKLRWLARHQPDRLARTAVIVQPKDYVNACLTGAIAGDRWTSKGIVSLNPARHTEPLRLVGVDPRLAPPCGRPLDIVGRVTREAARVTGLPAGIPVAIGWSDTLGAALATAPDAGDGFAVVGTSTSVGLLVDRAVPPDPRVLVAPVWDTGWHIVYGPSNSGVPVLHWAASALGLAPDTFDRAAARLADGPTPATPLFVPYLFGERSPLWNPAVRGAWFGLGAPCDPELLAAAVWEGLALAEHAVLEAAEAAAGTPARRVAWLGGHSAPPAAQRIRAGLVGPRGVLVDTEPARGAAFLAYWAAAGTRALTVPAAFRPPTTPLPPGPPWPPWRARQWAAAQAAVVQYADATPSEEERDP